MRAARFLLIPLLAASVAGCGAEDVSPEAIADAAETTADAGTARVRTLVTIPAAAGDDLEVEANGVMKMDGQLTRLTMDLSQIPGGEGELEMRSSGLTIWMRLPMPARKLPSGKEWIKIDLQKTSQEVGLDLDALVGATNDPAKQLDYLRAAGEVERVGTEGVRGVQTTHYRAVADLLEYVELLPEEERADARRGLKTFLDGADTRVPTEVWIDEDNLVRRMRMTMPMQGPGGKTVEGTLDQELYDFGVAVDVEPPPAETVLDATRFAREAARDLER